MTLPPSLPSDKYGGSYRTQILETPRKAIAALDLLAGGIFRNHIRKGLLILKSTEMYTRRAAVI